MDMSATYRAGAAFCFPHAAIVYDRFHIKKLMLDAMDEVRRAEQGTRSCRSRKAGRKLLMIPARKATASQRERTEALCQQYPKTGRAYCMVQMIDDIYCSRDVMSAAELLRRLMSWMAHSRLDPMKRAAHSLKKHADGILAYFRSLSTNAFAEGMSSLIQTAKRKARGFRTFEGFRTSIFLVAGRLQFQCPAPYPLEPQQTFRGSG